MLISVIIPCYNVEQYIEECLQSVINQTYQNTEIICIDNNSSDNTWNVLIELQKKYPKLILEKELKKGAPAARNKGLCLAKGDWIQFLDADDLLLEPKIGNQINLLKANPNTTLAFIAAASVLRNIKGQETSITRLNPDFFLAPFINQSGNTCSNLWSKSMLKSINGWDENLKSSQETDLMLRLILNGAKFIVDEIPNTIIRERLSGQISQRKPEERLTQYIEIRLNYISKLRESHYNEFIRIKNILYDFLMVTLIELASHNKKKALNYYNSFIKNNWKSSYRFGINKSKYFFIKLFGFRAFLFFAK